MFPTGYHWITIELILYYRYVSVKGTLLNTDITQTLAAVLSEYEKVEKFLSILL